MLQYTQLKKNRRKFLALTGLTSHEFQELLPAFRRAYERVHPANRTTHNRLRRRATGGGRRGNLKSLEQKLLFILVYQKAYPLQVLLGAAFDLSQSRANYWIHHLLPLLKATLDDWGMLPERRLDQFAKTERRQTQSSELIIDGTERRRLRPKQPEKQAVHYSGKKKSHTDKNVVIVNRRTQRIRYLSQTYPGAAHDKKIADYEHITYRRETILHQDSGFQGYQPAGCQMHQPKKSRAPENSRQAKNVTIANLRAFESRSNTRWQASSARAPLKTPCATPRTVSRI